VGALTALLAAVALASPGTQVPLSGVDNVSRWAYVMERVVARDRPDNTGQPVGILPTVTPEGDTNLVLTYAAERDANDRLWVRVPLSVLPNGRSGWVPRDALGDLHRVRTHLVISRARLHATLLRDGRAVFSTGIGVGRSRTTVTRSTGRSRSGRTRARPGSRTGPKAALSASTEPTRRSFSRAASPTAASACVTRPSSGSRG
jgi:hypothetical protein